MFSIYKLRNENNGKVYIGYTGQEPHSYIQEHFANARNGRTKLLYDAIRKHGEENFTYEVLYQTNHKDHATAMEKHFITEYDSFVKTGKGYNVTFGGDGGNTSHSPKYKAGIKARDLTGANNGNWGGLSEQHKANLSAAKKGKQPGNYDKFIKFAKGKVYMHEPASQTEIRVSPSEVADNIKIGFVQGRLRIPCEFCGMLSDKGNMKRHIKTRCPNATK